MVRVDHTTTNAGRTKKDNEDLGILKYDLYGTFAPDEQHRPVQFLGKSNSKWDFLTTKPPDIQL